MAENKKQIVECPAFQDQKEKYEIWQDLCEGGDRIEKNEAYLPKHPFESDTQYKIRKALATYKNHAKPIVTVFTSSVWRKPPDRKELTKDLEEYLNDVDTFGTSADMFFRTNDQLAAEIGLQFILVDSTRAPEGVEVKTKKDSKKYKIRPYFVAVPALSVVCWGFDDQGLSFVVIKETQTETLSPFEESAEKTIYKIWYRDSWESWAETEKEGLVPVDSGAHGCGEVPIVPIYFKKKSEMVGESCIKDIASILSRAYNLENSLDKSLFDTAFPLQAFYGFDPEAIKEFIRDSSNGLVTPDPEAKSEYVEPAGHAFSALDTKIKNDEVSIREIALRMVRPQSKAIESAESKKIDQQQLHSQLSVFSQNCQDAEVKCWQLMLKWMNSNVDAGEIVYNDDFDVDKVSGDLLRAFSEMRRNRDISRETYWKALQKAEFPFPDDFDLEDEKERLESDARSTGTMADIGSRLLPGTGGEA